MVRHKQVLIIKYYYRGGRYKLFHVGLTESERNILECIGAIIR